MAEAFLSTHTSKPSVLTLSIHHHAPFFFPSSPASALTSTDTQSPHTLSLPLAEGTSPTTLARVWSLVENVKASFQPDFVVVCCGVDGLAGDGKGVWNLGSGNGAGELSWVVRKICDWGLGTVLLGGGQSAYSLSRLLSTILTMSSVLVVSQEGTTIRRPLGRGLSSPLSPSDDLPSHRIIPFPSKNCRTSSSKAMHRRTT